ncbi:hypothetical protein BKA70DRAFT_1182465 [Coprinopsis sp. MPI-PUGE-AT-0042]|nr:hypothetical protein BKA70DRAFT_1182465 [Coprinopsis sp. MPI-PUGE-AT-0042]
MAQCSVRSTTRGWSQRLLLQPKLGSRTPAQHHAFSSSTSQGRPAEARATTTIAASPIASATPISEPLTLWHKTSKVLPKALNAQVGGSRLPSLDTWESILSTAYDDLSSASSRPIRILVHGLDECAGAEDLVTALVADPLGPSEHWKAVQERWNSAGERVTISHSPDLSIQPGSLTLPSPSLQRFPVPLEITELRTPPSTRAPSSHSLDNTTLSQLFEADIPILLVNPLVTSLDTLLSTPLPRNTILIVRAPPSPSFDVSRLLVSLPRSASKPTIILADPSRASKAIQLMQSNSTTSSSTVQRFQDEFTGSNISAVTSVLQDLLQAPAKSVGATKHTGLASDYLRVKFALAKLEDALSACLASIEGIKTKLDQACVEASRLSDRVEETSAKVEHDVLGPSSSLPPSPQNRNAKGNEVQEALKQAEKQMQEVMERFTWWRMIWRVDEITNLVSSALERTWCPELERKLLLQTGQLAALQKEFSQKSFELLSRNEIVQSNVLRNTLLQLQSSTAYPLSTNSLTSVITSRRNQIVEYPTARLHLSAQRGVLGMSGGTFSGAAIGWTGWMGWLVGSGDGILGVVGLDPNTAMGVGALLAAASVRWCVGKWERAKKKWWEDWHRVGDGLDRDLRVRRRLGYLLGFSC